MYQLITWRYRCYMPTMITVALITESLSFYNITAIIWTCLPKSMCWKRNLQIHILMFGALWDWIRIRWGHQGESLWWHLCHSSRRGRYLSQKLLFSHTVTSSVSYNAARKPLIDTGLLLIPYWTSAPQE